MRFPAARKRTSALTSAGSAPTFTTSAPASAKSFVAYAPAMPDERSSTWTSARPRCMRAAYRERPSTRTSRRSEAGSAAVVTPFASREAKPRVGSLRARLRIACTKRISQITPVAGHASSTVWLRCAPRRSSRSARSRACRAERRSVRIHEMRSSPAAGPARDRARRARFAFSCSILRTSRLRHALGTRARSRSPSRASRCRCAGSRSTT